MSDGPARLAGAGEFDRKILEVFRSRPEGVVSGEALSQQLNVSRTAVWKHIRNLKALGYRIDAVPSRGYRLVASPDILTPAEITSGLATSRIGQTVICLRETESTNAVAFSLAEEGAAEGTVVIADVQSRGKGRLGRRWESPAGVNLYCSVVLRPPLLPLHAPQITFLSAVAAADAIARMTLLTPEIKWPNDVLVNGRKVAGMLNEMNAATEGIAFIILGIGININMRRDQFPDDLRHPASSLALEAGVEVARVPFIRAFLEALDARYRDFLARGFQPLKNAWLARCTVMNRRVMVSCRDGDLAGTVAGVDEIGALLLRRDGGGLERVLAGDVTVVD